MPKNVTLKVERCPKTNDIFLPEKSNVNRSDLGAFLSHSKISRKVEIPLHFHKNSIEDLPRAVSGIQIGATIFVGLGLPGLPPAHAANPAQPPDQPDAVAGLVGPEDAGLDRGADAAPPGGHRVGRPGRADPSAAALVRVCDGQLVLRGRFSKYCRRTLFQNARGLRAGKKR